MNGVKSSGLWGQACLISLVSCVVELLDPPHCASASPLTYKHGHQIPRLLADCMLHKKRDSHILLCISSGLHSVTNTCVVK